MLNDISNFRHKCLLQFCFSNVNNFSKHMAQCHPDIIGQTKEVLLKYWRKENVPNESMDIEKLVDLDKTKCGMRDGTYNNDSSEEKSKTKKVLRACAFKGCTFRTRNIWSHLIKAHELKKGTKQYNDILHACKRLCEATPASDRLVGRDDDIHEKIDSWMASSPLKEVTMNKKRIILSQWLRPAIDPKSLGLNVNLLVRATDLSVASKGMFDNPLKRQASTILIKSKTVISFLNFLMSKYEMDLGFTDYAKNTHLSSCVTKIKGKCSKLFFFFFPFFFFFFFFFRYHIMHV